MNQQRLEPAWNNWIYLMWMTMQRNNFIIVNLCTIYRCNLFSAFSSRFSSYSTIFSIHVNIWIPILTAHQSNTSVNANKLNKQVCLSRCKRRKTQKLIAESTLILIYWLCYLSKPNCILKRNTYCIFVCLFVLLVCIFVRQKMIKLIKQFHKIWFRYFFRPFFFDLVVFSHFFISFCFWKP